MKPLSGLLPLVLLIASTAAVANDATPLNLTSEQIAAAGIEARAAKPVREAPGAIWPARLIEAADAEWMTTAPLAGVVERVLVVEGQRVQRGDVLAEIASPDLAAELAMYRTAQAQFALARDQRERERRLLAEGLIAARRLQEAEVAYAGAQAELQRSEQTLRMAGIAKPGQVSGARLTIRAERAGVVAQRSVRAGQRVAAADPLVQLVADDRLWAEVLLPAASAHTLKAGDRFRLLPANVEAVVGQSGWSVQPGSQAVRVQLELRQPPATLRPGQTLQAQQLHTVSEPAFEVPAAAVIHEGDAAAVFVRADRGYVHQPVKLLGEGAGSAVVAGPLQGRDVAVRGVAYLKSATAAGAPSGDAP